MKTSQNKSLLPSQPKSKSREVRKLEGQRDRALGRLQKFKAKGRRKKAQRCQQALARQVVSLTMKTTQAVIDGEV